jgi:hypothetical protein
MSRVFVSSTVHDLIDVRAEVETLLRDLTLIPVMSDRPSPDFDIPPDQHSIEACLVNLRTCGTCITLLSQRYGPALTLDDHKDLSATHVEYREARKRGIGVLFYVRDKTHAVAEVERKNPGKDIFHNWIPRQYDVSRLTSFIQEHTKLEEGSPASNWLRTFTDSVDLKRQLRADLREQAARSQLEADISGNRIPLIDVSATVSEDTHSTAAQWPINITLTNVGTTPAFRITLECDGDISLPVEDLPVLAPGQSYTRTTDIQHQLHGTTQWHLRIHYYTSHGQKVQDRHAVGVTANPNRLPTCAAVLRNKTYVLGGPPVSLYDVVDINTEFEATR